MLVVESSLGVVGDTRLSQQPGPSVSVYLFRWHRIGIAEDKHSEVTKCVMKEDEESVRISFCSLCHSSVMHSTKT